MPQLLGYTYDTEAEALAAQEEVREYYDVPLPEEMVGIYHADTFYYILYYKSSNKDLADVLGPPIEFEVPYPVIPPA